MHRRSLLALFALLLLGGLLCARDSFAQSGRLFAQTGYRVREPFLSFWQRGGLDLYGYPISPELQEPSADDGQTYTVQYFERARLELHPGSAQIVELGRLGAARLHSQPPGGKALEQPNDASCLSFAESGQSLCREFASLWRERGGLAAFGYPLTPPLLQRAADGSWQVVQYTERARFELDPASTRVGLGLLGRESYTPQPQASAAPPLDPSDARLIALVNQERAAAGLEALTVAPALMDAAAGHSFDMASSGLISHSGSDGRGAAQRMRDAGYAWQHCGENIAVSYASPEEAMAFWMNSPPHRANILDPEFRELGVSHLVQAGGWNHYWTLDLGRAVE